MKVLAPIDGVLEWRVENGAPVTEGMVLGWIAGPGRCGLVPLTAGKAGRLRWRRTGALETIDAGEPAALIDGDEAELRSCRAVERQAAKAGLRVLEREVASLERDESAQALHLELLRPQRRGLEARLATLRALADE
ncbi:MAG: hypothetical protein Q8L48_14125 [Archangium sp.]|nr:hypothetical protein [Archangium sp.]